MALAECACGAQGRRGAPADLELWQPFLLVQPAPWLAPKELLCHRVQGHELVPSGDLSPRASTSGPWRPGCLTAGTRRCTHRRLRSCPCPRRPCCLHHHLLRCPSIHWSAAATHPAIHWAATATHPAYHWSATPTLHDSTPPTPPPHATATKRNSP